MTGSTSINKAIYLAEAEENTVSEISTGWSKVREVVDMVRPMTDTLRANLMADNRLRFWTEDGTPHNKRCEGFIDDIGSVAISFPRME